MKDHPFLTVVAWLGVVIVLIGIIISFNTSHRLLFPDASPYHPVEWTTEYYWMFTFALDILGLLMMLIGGLIAKPFLYREIIIGIGILHIFSFFGFYYGLFFHLFKYQNLSSFVARVVALEIIPAIIIFTESYWLRVLEKRKKEYDEFVY